MNTIGFIGLGNMGRPMAQHIASAGFDPVCFDVAGTTDRLPDGARAVTHAAEVFALADTVLFSVPDGAATADLVAQLADSHERRVSTVIDLSTVGPMTARAAAARLGPLGVSYCDGPVSGGTAGARAKTISLMFAGAASVLETHRPLLESFTGRVFHVGELPGQGQSMKLLNNFLSAVAMAATSEAVAFGRAEGLDPAVIIEVLNASSGRNSATVDKFPNRILTGSYDAGFHTRLMYKDISLFVEAAAAAGTADLLARTAADVWAAADAAMPGSDFTEIFTFVSRQRSDGEPRVPQSRP